MYKVSFRSEYDVFLKDYSLNENSQDCDESCYETMATNPSIFVLVVHICEMFGIMLT